MAKVDINHLRISVLLASPLHQFPIDLQFFSPPSVSHFFQNCFFPPTLGQLMAFLFASVLSSKFEQSLTLIYAGSYKGARARCFHLAFSHSSLLPHPVCRDIERRLSYEEEIAGNESHPPQKQTNKQKHTRINAIFSLGLLKSIPLNLGIGEM